MRVNNARLDKLAKPYLGRLPGRPTKDGDEFAIELGQYRAASWTRSYRLVLVVVDLPDPKTGLRQLFPHYFFLVTNWQAERRSAWGLVEHYRKRGTFEDRLGEFNAVKGAVCANAGNPPRNSPFSRLPPGPRPGRINSQRLVNNPR